MNALRHKPTLEGARIRLVPMTVRHTDALAANINDPELRRLTGTHARFSIEQLRTWTAGRAAEEDRLDLVIEDRATGAFVGELAVLDVDVDNEAASMRIALTQEHVGRGLGTEAIRLLLDYCFERVNLHRVQLDVFAFNERAIRSYRKCGFVEEGRLRDTLLWDGERHDSIIMSVLRPG